MFNRIARVWRFKKTLVGAFWLLALLRVALFCLPYRKVRLFVAQTPCKRGRRRLSIDDYQAELVWAIQLAGRYLLGHKPCLPQALAVQWFLLRQGVTTDLNIGVQKDAVQGISAHAWVERNGRVIIGGALSPSQFKPLHLVKS